MCVCVYDDLRTYNMSLYMAYDDDTHTHYNTEEYIVYPISKSRCILCIGINMIFTLHLSI